MKGNKKIIDYCENVVQYLKNKDDALKYSIGSNAKIDVICPMCGYEHKMIVSNLTHRHYSCPMCGDGISFPEKLMLNVLTFINEPFIYQLNKKTFEWCGKYKYDFYLTKKNIIIEVDGSQHYNSEMKFNGALSLFEVQQNDINKINLAKENGISDVLHIDCSSRNPIDIKNNILLKTNNILDLTNLNWEVCFSNASKSKIYEVCKKWEEVKDYMDANELSQILGISRDRVVRYLHKGTLAGFCEYDGKKERIRASHKGVAKLNKKRKQILVFDTDGKFIREYSSARSLINESLQMFGVKFTYIGIVETCNGRQKTHKNYKFKYKND